MCVSQWILFPLGPQVHQKLEQKKWNFNEYLINWYHRMQTRAHQFLVHWNMWLYTDVEWNKYMYMKVENYQTWYLILPELLLLSDKLSPGKNHQIQWVYWCSVSNLMRIKCTVLWQKTRVFACLHFQQMEFKTYKPFPFWNYLCSWKCIMYTGNL